MSDASPRPWFVNGHSIEANDPDGLWLQNEKTGRGVVANLPSCPKSRMSVENRKTWDAIVEANAVLIVDAVNQYEWANEEIHRLTVEKDDMFDEAVEIRDERDHLRDLVKRLITVHENIYWRKDERTGMLYYDCAIDEEKIRKTIEEARETIKGDK